MWNRFGAAAFAKIPSSEVFPKRELRWPCAGGSQTLEWLRFSLVELGRRYDAADDGAFFSRSAC